MVRFNRVYKTGGVCWESTKQDGTVQYMLSACDFQLQNLKVNFIKLVNSGIAKTFNIPISTIVHGNNWKLSLDSCSLSQHTPKLQGWKERNQQWLVRKRRKWFHRGASWYGENTNEGPMWLSWPSSAREVICPFPCWKTWGKNSLKSVHCWFTEQSIGSKITTPSVSSSSWLWNLTYVCHVAYITGYSIRSRLVLFLWCMKHQNRRCQVVNSLGNMFIL